ncbi:hypothetical protein [Nocardia gipuzkoensis]|uniref:hypothetical protein n=1 Tax=Nocardia gipuzkoensis TaxID=2749991 RepID=UPI00237E38F6|nr:hypothetical protein [Nocardia gipuzkoensis]MDE1674773.1 hypothetical protein [Nocardia gipuzkoensis]
MVVAALAAGAAAGLTDTAKKAVGDAYQAMKSLVVRRYDSVEAEIVGIEKDPHQELRRQLLAAELMKVGAGDDQELLAAAKALLLVIHEHEPAAAESVGVRLTRVAAGHEIEIADVESAGSGVIATDVSAGGALRIRGISAGGKESPHPPSARQ